MKIGLVLAGGGGRGAYHIGVWKALKEYGIDEKISAVAGTSVGGLNAVLFAQGDYEKAEAIWENISPDQILSKDGVKNLAKIGEIITKKKLEYNGSIFSREGMIRLIEENVNWDKIRNGRIDCFAAAVKIRNESALGNIIQLASTNQLATNVVSKIASIAAAATLTDATYFDLKKYDDQTNMNILLATSAIPIVFPEQKIDGTYYIDGGLSDNVPFKPLCDMGYDMIIVVHLRRDKVLDFSKYPTTRFIEIMPENDMGGILDGTLDFKKENAKRRIMEGYLDTIRILAPIFEMHQINQRQMNAFQQMKQEEEVFKKKSLHMEQTLDKKKEILKSFIRGN